MLEDLGLVVPTATAGRRLSEDGARFLIDIIGGADNGN
jgi:hypothetical protein